MTQRRCKEGQKDGASNEEFVRSIFALVDKCDYGDLKDEQLREKLCHGMRDRKLAAELRSNEQLTLEDVLKRMRSKDAILKDLHEEQERVRDTAKQVRSEIKSGALDAVSKFQRPQPPASRGPSLKPEQLHASASKSGNPPVITHIKSCKFCGTSHRYGKSYCPSKDSGFRLCKEVGHYAKLCPKQLKSLTYQDESDPEQFSGGDYYTVCSVSTPSLHRPLRANVQLGRYLVNFKVDSGADVSAISLEDYNKLSPPHKCRSTQARLVGVAHQPLETVGVFATEMKYKSVSHKEKIFVIKGLDDNILSRRACDSL
jgi:hypothetical protein